MSKRFLLTAKLSCGEVAEWFNAAVLESQQSEDWRRAEPPAMSRKSSIKQSFITVLRMSSMLCILMERWQSGLMQRS